MREHKDILSPFLPWLQHPSGKRWCVEAREKMPQWPAPTSEKILCGVDIPHPLGFKFSYQRLQGKQGRVLDSISNLS